MMMSSHLLVPSAVQRPAETWALRDSARAIYQLLTPLADRWRRCSEQKQPRTSDSVYALERTPTFAVLRASPGRHARAELRHGSRPTERRDDSASTLNLGLPLNHEPARAMSYIGARPPAFARVWVGSPTSALRLMVDRQDHEGFDGLVMVIIMRARPGYAQACRATFRAGARYLEKD